MAPVPGSNCCGCGMWNRDFRDLLSKSFPCKGKTRELPSDMAKGSSSPSGLFGSPPLPHLLIGVTKTGADKKWEGWASIHPTPVSIHPPLKKDTLDAYRDLSWPCQRHRLFQMMEYRMHTLEETPTETGLRSPVESNRAILVSAQGARSTYKPDGSNATAGCCHAFQWGWHQDHGRHHRLEDPWWHLVPGANQYTYLSCLGGIFLQMLPNAFWYRPKNNMNPYQFSICICMVKFLSESVHLPVHWTNVGWMPHAQECVRCLGYSSETVPS